MHDPSTLAFSIKLIIPWRKERGTFKNDPPQFQRVTLFDIWHEDPCKGPGGDDSCGWFKRAHHGDPAVLAKIAKRFEFDWDRTFKSDGTSNVYFCGLFCPNGDPNLSVQAIVLNLFFLAVGEHFQSTGATNWNKARRWMQKNLFEIMFFAENPTDSLFDTITRKFEIGCGEKHDARARQERIEKLAAIIYGWILRKTTPWYRHPRWHIHHWKIQCPFTSKLKRWIWSRCMRCGKRFPWKSSVCTNNWNSTGPRWFRGEKDIYHADCRDVHSSGCCDAEPKTPA